MSDLIEEYHVVILWNNALCYKQELIMRIEQKLEIVGYIRYKWEEEKADKNFATFYGEKLENISFKVRHCGSGEFLIILVKDSIPCYEIRSTSSGKRMVNTNLFDLKSELRMMTGGGHMIHATDDQHEVRQNIASLFGKTLQEMLPIFQENSGILFERNISGVDGWKSWNEMLNILNLGTDYVLLRNYDSILEELNEHGDTDILVRSYQTAITLIAGRKVFRNRNRVMYSVIIGGKEREIDIRYLGDNYYCSEFEKEILDKREYSRDRHCYIQNEELLAYSLLYHAMIHKSEVANDYSEYFKRYFLENSQEELRHKLSEFMHEKKFSYTMPRDYSVYINPDYFSEIKDITMRRKVYVQLINIRKRLKKCIKHFDK